MTPEEIIQRQVMAYNARDIDAFVGCHHPEAVLYNYTEEAPFAQGRAEVRKLYGGIFSASPELHSEVTQRMIMGDKVIDHEIITGRQGVDKMLIIAIYSIEDGLIRRADFIRG